MGGHLGPFCGPFGASWWPFWNCLGPSLERKRPNIAQDSPSWAENGSRAPPRQHFGALLGPTWAYQGVWGPSWGDLGAFSGPFWGLLGAMRGQVKAAEAVCSRKTRKAENIVDTFGFVHFKPLRGSRLRPLWDPPVGEAGSLGTIIPDPETMFSRGLE